MRILVSFHADPSVVSALLRISAHFWDLMEATVSLISLVRRLIIILTSGFPSLWCCRLRSFLYSIFLLRLSGSISACPACLLANDVVSSVARETGLDRLPPGPAAQLFEGPSGLGGNCTPSI
ncbi:hypothetical protein QE152_g40489 [Popillia japonica]|uniref:Uncharacterized protein n=1 Tax=Popillia japonica TaxID=7064 RepID=A0AAW1HG42_POPJA